MVTAVKNPLLETDACVHSWLIEPPNGPSSIGRCLHCPAQREFLNSIQDDRRVNNSDIFSGRPKAGSRQLWNDEVELDRAVEMMRR